METMQARAKVGGEVGANGEFYEGGKFIATTDRAKKAQDRKNAKLMGKKVETAPYEWSLRPSLEAKAIFSEIRGGFVDLRSGAVNEQACAYYGRDPKVLAALFVQWSNGERWM